MLIAIAGPYSAQTELQKQANLNLLNEYAAKIYKLGHIPIIGVNAALPVVNSLDIVDKNKPIMDISLAIVERCDALFLISESPGAIKERDLILSLGKPVFYSFSEIN